MEGMTSGVIHAYLPGLYTSGLSAHRLAHRVVRLYTHTHTHAARFALPCLAAGVHGRIGKAGLEPATVLFRRMLRSRQKGAPSAFGEAQPAHQPADCGNPYSGISRILASLMQHDPLTGTEQNYRNWFPIPRRISHRCWRDFCQQRRFQQSPAA